MPITEIQEDQKCSGIFNLVKDIGTGLTPTYQVTAKNMLGAFKLIPAGERDIWRVNYGQESFLNMEDYQTFQKYCPSRNFSIGEPLHGRMATSFSRIF